MDTPHKKWQMSNSYNMYSVFHTTITVPRVLPVYEWPLEFPIPHEIVFLEEWRKSGITISIPRGMGKWEISFFHSLGNEE